MKNYLIAAFFSFTLLWNLNAQNASDPLAITVGTNAVNLSIEGQGSDDEYSFATAFSYLQLSKYLGAGFSVDLAGTFNELSRESGAKELYTAIDLGTTLTPQKHNLWNIDPSISAGIGYVDIENNDWLFAYLGAGLKYNFTSNLGVSVKLKYKTIAKELDKLLLDGEAYRSEGNDGYDLNHFQALAGLTFSFGDGDTDGDGVKDSVDECPNVPGLESLNGCPDDDGDGIKNSADDCPLTAGIAALNGCPDADGDGVKDSDDKCPDVAGLAALNGCPDADGDGIQDDMDACPNEPGDRKMRGCPDADGDGVADKDDKCPTEAGPKSNNGCPLFPLSMLEDYDINFELEKYNIDSEDVQKLSTVIKVLLANKDAKISIEGHADNTGEESYNNPLSTNRAKSIYDYLVNVGISADNLSTKAFGESMPKATNETAEGRAINRRVEFVVVE